MATPPETCLLCNQPLIKLEGKDNSLTIQPKAIETMKSADIHISEKSLCINKLSELIKQKKNNDFKYIVSSINQSQLISAGGKTLMHAAAATNNIEILIFLSGLGYDINAQNELGQTPVHVAIESKNFQAVQLLLSHDADILVTDHKDVSTLQICFQKDTEIPEYIVVCFLERLKRSGLSVEQMANQLENSGCSILQALSINNAEVIARMLNQRSCIDKRESRTILERATSFHYPESVKALVKHGPGLNIRFKIFLNMVTEHRFKPKMKFYFEQIVNWDLITEDLLGMVTDIFENQNEDRMQMYLDIGIDEYIRKKFDRELLVGLFSNDNVEDCIKIVKGRQFDVNGHDMSGNTALHAAVRNEDIPAVVYLLNNAADPNIKNSQGETPIFNYYTSNNGIIELLYEAGADMQATNNYGETILYKSYPVAEIIIAKLGILEARGLLKQQLRDVIKDCSRRERLFNCHLEDLEWMKTHKISKSVTLFTVLIDNVTTTARNVRNLIKKEDDIASMLEASYERELQTTYDSMLTKNLKKALKMNQCRSKAALFFADVMNVGQSDHLAIEKIIEFLNYRDMLIFDEIHSLIKPDEMMTVDMK